MNTNNSSHKKLSIALGLALLSATETQPMQSDWTPRQIACVGAVIVTAAAALGCGYYAWKRRHKSPAVTSQNNPTSHTQTPIKKTKGIKDYVLIPSRQYNLALGFDVLLNGYQSIGRFVRDEDPLGKKLVQFSSYFYKQDTAPNNFKE